MRIEIEHLHFSYGERPVLRDVCLGIGQAETLSILGPNGAGKTTLLGIIAGLLAPGGGSVLYDGKPRGQYGLRQMARMVGYVPQITEAAFDYAVVDYVVTGCAPQIGALQRPGARHYDAAMDAIQEMGIGHLAQKSYRQISGGERQQVAIARALAQGPAFILMDEPTSHLDYGNQLKVLRTIRRLAQRGYGIVFTTHNPDHALLLGGRTAIVDRGGTLTAGDAGELIREDLLFDIYGTRLRIDSLGGAGRRICYAPTLDDEGRI